VEPVEALAKARAEVDAVLLVLELEPRAADAEDPPAVADVVESRGHLRHEPGIAERVGTDEQAEARLLRGHRPRGEGRPPFDDRLIRVAEDRVDVVPGPEVVIAEAVDALRGVQQLGPRRGLAPQEDPEL